MKARFDSLDIAPEDGVFFSASSLLLERLNYFKRKLQCNKKTASNTKTGTFT